MKSTLKTLSLSAMIVALSSCGSIQYSTSPASSTHESASSSSSISSISSSSEADPYEGRIKPIDFSVVDLVDCPFDGSDERIFDPAKPIADYIRPEKVKMYYLDQTNDVYFLDLTTFANIFKNEYREGYTAMVSDDGNLATWDVKKGEEVVFRLSMNAKTQTMSLIGELDSTFLKSAPYGKTGEEDYAQITYSYLPGHENVERYYPFAEYEFDFFKVDGHYCYPFALLNLALNQALERSFLFNTHEKQLFEYGSKVQLSAIQFATENAQTIDADTYLRQCFEEEYGQGKVRAAQPHALTVFNKKLYYFLMDSFYGLAKQKGITSMSDYLDTFDYSAYFDSDDGGERLYAYGRSVDMLNDLHSTYYPSPYFDEFAAKDYHYEQTFNKDRYDLRDYLFAQRKAKLKEYNDAHGTKLALTDMRYSADGKYGYFSFDSFDTYNTCSEDPLSEKELLHDTFYLFVRNLTEAREKGVQRLIIDDTCNGGGYVGIMAKLLALMSKDNKSEVFLRCDGNDAILKTFTRVDSNHDGQFDVSDCFGNDFQFYIVTSNFSFSCGNAFPFYAKHYDFAKIVGARSGGGECCVFNYAFPSGQEFRTSSPYHVGYWDEEKGVYIGDEYGAAPFLSSGNDFNELYDIDVIAAKLEELDPSTTA